MLYSFPCLPLQIQFRPARNNFNLNKTSDGGYENLSGTINRYENYRTINALLNPKREINLVKKTYWIFDLNSPTLPVTLCTGQVRVLDRKIENNRFSIGIISDWVSIKILHVMA